MSKEDFVKNFVNVKIIVLFNFKVVTVIKDVIKIHVFVENLPENVILVNLLLFKILNIF